MPACPLLLSYLMTLTIDVVCVLFDRQNDREFVAPNGKIAFKNGDWKQFNRLQDFTNWEEKLSISFCGAEQFGTVFK